VRLVAAAVAALALAAPAAAAGTPYSFGREGGNIRPFSVTISSSGTVHVVGPVNVGRRKLTSAQLAAIGKVVTSAGFGKLPATTLCPRTLPDIAATFVSVGSKTVRVHGNCLARYAKVWNALTAAVRISY